MSDNVNHPKHYTSHPSGVECITVAEHYGFNIGNTFKYLWRAGLKGDAIEDLEKAAWYLNREIEKRKKELELSGAGSEEPAQTQNNTHTVLATVVTKPAHELLIGDLVVIPNLPGDYHNYRTMRIANFNEVFSDSHYITAKLTDPHYGNIEKTYPVNEIVTIIKEEK